MIATPNFKAAIYNSYVAIDRGIIMSTLSPLDKPCDAKTLPTLLDCSMSCWYVTDISSPSVL